MNAVLPLSHILLKTKGTGFSETSHSIFFITTAARASYFLYGKLLTSGQLLASQELCFIGPGNEVSV